MDLGRKAQLGVGHALARHLACHQTHGVAQARGRLQKRQRLLEAGEEIVQARAGFRNGKQVEQLRVVGGGQGDALRLGQLLCHAHRDRAVQMCMQIDVASRHVRVPSGFVCPIMHVGGRAGTRGRARYSTVTLLARLRGWSTSQPRISATSRASSCRGTLAVMGLKASRTRGM